MMPAFGSRAPKGFAPVAKSRICIASPRYSSIRYVEYSPSSRLGPLATAQLHSAPQPVRCFRQTFAVRRLRLLLLFGAASLADLGCLDLTLPPEREAGSAGGALPGRSADSALAPSPTGGTGAGGQGGGGHLGGTLPNDARELGGATQLPSGGSGGIVTLGAGGISAVSTTAVGGSGGRIVTFPGEGGAGGGTAAGKDSASVVPDGDGGTPGAPDVSLSPDAHDAVADAPNSVPTKGLVAYYTCERAEGTMLRDQSGNGNHGTLGTGVGGGGSGGSTGGGYLFESGKIGDGLTLVQAYSGYVSLPVAMFKDAATITISTWIRLNSLTTWQRVFDIGINAHLKQNPMTGTVYSNLVLKDLNNKLGLNSTTNGYGGEQRITADVFPIGVWKHLAIVVGTRNAALYVDGTLVGFASSLPTLKALGALDYAFIGRSQFTGDPPLDAQIDEFRIYNRALFANEIEALFAYAGP
jgi:hypothetical protein